MKKLILFLALCMPVVNIMASIEQSPADTTIVLDNKRIEVRNDEDRVKVRVYEFGNQGDLIEGEMIFEGHYRDGKSVERRKFMGAIEIPTPFKAGDFDPHWSGFSFGLANFSNSTMQINTFDNFRLWNGNSFEYNLNLFERAIPFAHNRLALVSGLGLRWSRYRFEGNVYLKEDNGYSGLHAAEDGVNYIKSKLNINYITIPVLLEWQIAKRGTHSKLFVSAGVVGNVKYSSTSKVVYLNSQGKKQQDKLDEGMNLRILTMDFLVQAGLEDWSIYARYSPITLFEGGKGPDVQPVAIGLQLHF